MFKQVLTMIISSIITYILTFYILRKNYRRFYFINGIIKYPLNCTIKNASFELFSQVKNSDNFIFYSRESINCENYIYDKDNDKYYIIEPGFYYYINNKNNLILNCNVNSFIYYLKIK